MSGNCPAPVGLLLRALGRDDGIHGATLTRHIEECSTCRSHLLELREVAAALHSAVPAAGTVSSDCLDDDGIAALADGLDLARDRGPIAHVAECAICGERLAAVVHVMEDAAVVSEIDALHPPARLMMPRRFVAPKWPRRTVFVLSGLAAAAVATIVLLGPARSRAGRSESAADSATHREAAITTAAAPQILSRGDMGGSDSLRWTSVPQADLYRIRVWDHEGTVVWTTDTRDTVLVLPLRLTSAAGSYLLDVKARTGWDRWVSSDFVELAVRPPSR